MARTVREKDYFGKRNEILDAAQKLIYMRGYTQMTIQGILEETGISKGAFYHYFNSKENLLEAVIDRMLDDGEHMLRQIADEAGLNALEKLQRFFETGGRWKAAQRGFLMELVRVWYQDENSIVREKIYREGVSRTAPVLTQIFKQGLQEGSITTSFPDQLGEVVMCLLESLSQSFARQLLARERLEDAYENIRLTTKVYQEALERVLGVPAGSLTIVDNLILDEWIRSDVQ